MNKFKHISLSVFLIVTLSSSCISPHEEITNKIAFNLSSTPPSTVLPKFLITQSVLPAIGANQNTPIPTDSMFIGSDQFGDGFIAKTPIREVENATPEEIMNILINKRLEHYLSKDIEPYYRLDDYFVYKIEIKDYYHPPYEIFAEVQFFFKPSQFPNGWMAASVSYARDWQGYHEVFGIFRDGDFFRLRLLAGWGS
jgi:hypothetical protein